MSVDNLSKHGIVTGNLIIMFVVIIIILAANKIHDINNLAEHFKDFNEFNEHPPPSLALPIDAIIISLVMIATTALMISGIITQRLLLLAPWLILFGFGIISEMIFFVHQLLQYFSLELLLYMLCILGIQLLMFSPIALIFYEIHSKCKTNLQETNSSTV